MNEKKTIVLDKSRWFGCKEHISARQNPSDFVYFISDGTAVKIGKSSGSPSGRLDNLQTGNPRRLTLVCAIPAKDESSAFIIEDALHGVFSKHHVRGEWFDIAGIDIQSCLLSLGVTRIISDDHLEEHTNNDEAKARTETRSEKRFMTVRETAKLGIMPEFTIRKLIKIGRCPGFRSGSRFYVDIERFEMMLDEMCDVYDVISVEGR